MTRDSFKDCDLNTAQQAFNRLAAEPGLTTKGETLVTRRKIAPSGTVSDGHRILTLQLCPRARWIEIVDGWGKSYVNLDQRDYWEQPDRLAAAVLAAIAAMEA